MFFKAMTAAVLIAGIGLSGCADRSPNHLGDSLRMFETPQYNHPEQDGTYTLSLLKEVDGVIYAKAERQRDGVSFVYPLCNTVDSPELGGTMEVHVVHLTT